jgi:nitrogenase subunit NifH
LYDDTKGKAYSYFGTIAKRYLIVYNNNNYKRLKGKAAVEEVDEDKTLLNNLVLNNENNLEEVEFIDLYIAYIDENLLEIFPKEQEARVGDAILELFKRRETIDIFNKKALFIYIKEITDSPTPIITKVIKVLKGIYKEMLNKYLEEGSEINIFTN